MERVLLVTMPFGSASRPSIGLSLLKAGLTRDGLPCDIRYLNLCFAERIGGVRYERIAHIPDGFTRLLLGDWIFAGDLFEDQIPPPEQYFSQVLSRPLGELTKSEQSQVFRVQGEAELLELRAHAGAFLDECLATVPWEDYPLIGFSTTFEQNTASLALARRIKKHHPDVAIVFGGANCEAEMGIALHRLFPFVDYVCSGEADLVFPLLARRILLGQPIGEVPGTIRRVNGQTVAPRAASAPVLDMDALPNPDYDDFVQQQAATDLQLETETSLLLETSRGCWWGQTAHCTFCGLNGTTMRFRAKSPQRALAELSQLTERYGTRLISAVDNILDMRYFREFLPRVAALDLEIELFYETKANLRREQVRLLHEAGVVRVQPGIESLNSSVLRLMRKGVTALQNIQLLRRCAEHMVLPFWNLLAGFPGEDPADYARQAEIVPLLTHLEPPTGVYAVRLDRFSPLFIDPEAMGIRNVRPASAYSYVYPFSAEDLTALAYYFDFDYADGRDPRSYIGELRRQVDVWIASHAERSQLTSFVDGDLLVICDTRPVAVQPEYRLRGLRRSVYELCDRAQTRSQLEAHLAALPTEHTDDGELDRVLEGLLAAKLMLYEDGCYLSLAVSAEYQMDYLARRHASRLPIRTSAWSAHARLLDLRAPTVTARYAEEVVAHAASLWSFPAMSCSARHPARGSVRAGPAC